MTRKTPTKTYKKTSTKKPQTTVKTVSYKKRYTTAKRDFNRLQSIKVKSDGLTSTFDVGRIGSYKSPFAKKMRERYASGVGNIITRFTPQQVQLNANVQALFAYSLFALADLSYIQSNLATPLTGIGNVSNTSVTFYEKANSSLYLTNSSNGPIFIDIYMFIAKHDSILTPIQAWIDGMKDMSNQTSTDYTLQYGVGPLDCPMVTQLYRCKRITHIELNAGQVHQQNYTYQKNCPLNNSRLYSAANGSFVSIGGWTTYFIGVCRGSPMSASNQSDVATTTSNIDIIFTESYVAKQIKDSTANYLFNAPNSLGSASQLFNIGSGAAAATTVI